MMKLHKAVAIFSCVLIITALLAIKVRGSDCAICIYLQESALGDHQETIESLAIKHEEYCKKTTQELTEYVKIRVQTDLEFFLKQEALIRDIDKSSSCFAHLKLPSKCKSKENDEFLESIFKTKEIEKIGEYQMSIDRKKIESDFISTAPLYKELRQLSSGKDLRSIKHKTLRQILDDHDSLDSTSIKLLAGLQEHPLLNGLLDDEEIAMIFLEEMNHSGMSFSFFSPGSIFMQEKIKHKLRDIYKKNCEVIKQEYLFPFLCNQKAFVNSAENQEFLLEQKVVTKETLACFSKTAIQKVTSKNKSSKSSLKNGRYGINVDYKKILKEKADAAQKAKDKAAKSNSNTTKEEPARVVTSSNPTSTKNSNGKIGNTDTAKTQNTNDISPSKNIPVINNPVIPTIPASVPAPATSSSITTLHPRITPVSESQHKEAAAQKQESATSTPPNKNSNEKVQGQFTQLSGNINDKYKVSVDAPITTSKPIDKPNDRVTAPASNETARINTDNSRNKINAINPTKALSLSNTTTEKVANKNVATNTTAKLSLTKENAQSVITLNNKGDIPSDKDGLMKFIQHNIATNRTQKDGIYVIEFESNKSMQCIAEFKNGQVIDIRIVKRVAELNGILKRFTK